jgi:hypothetical protein
VAGDSAAQSGGVLSGEYPVVIRQSNPVKANKSGADIFAGETQKTSKVADYSSIPVIDC